MRVASVHRLSVGRLDGVMVDEWSEPLSVDDMYGDWDYEAAVAVLERSLGPRSRTSLYDTVGSLGIGAGDAVLDIGGRDAGHSLALADRFGCRVMAVDPVEANIEQAARAIAEHDHGHLVEARLGSIEQIPADGAAFDLVFSRDMLSHVADVEQAFAECSRVLSATGFMVIHQVFATALMEPKEAQRIYASSAVVAERMSIPGFENAVDRTGFGIESIDVIGTEWAEASEEAGTADNFLLQIARLRRAKPELINELGEAAYRAMYSNALWSIYQMIGKLEARVYVLRPART
jgi:cyclopropane fatty-acyl-phospholipid synthase-like methyltransferase